MKTLKSFRKVLLEKSVIISIPLNSNPVGSNQNLEDGIEKNLKTEPLFEKSLYLLII
jgi:hypothetical protein